MAELKGKSSFSGADIRVYASIPFMDSPFAPPTYNNRNSRVFELGTLQTLSISSARSVTPVRTLGRSNPVAYARGGRTFAGTMVFATINSDPFYGFSRADFGESSIDRSEGLWSDKLPPFTVTVLAENEHGDLSMQVLMGVTITNFGTTYSVDDLFVETTYTYVALNVTPLLPLGTIVSEQRFSEAFFKTPVDLLEDIYKGAVKGTNVDLIEAIKQTLKNVNDAFDMDNKFALLNLEGLFRTMKISAFQHPAWYFYTK